MLNYISEAFEELKTNVTWPAWNDVQKYAVIVALFSVIFALATFAVDYVFTEALNLFFSKLR
jgi:preprotein translocase subunit SecE